MKPTASFRSGYSPGRRDARIGEARAFLATARHLKNMTARSLECQFNLKPATAEAMLAEEQASREAIDV